MNLEKDFLNAVGNRDFVLANQILFNNMLFNTNYQTLSDYGSFIADCGSNGMQLNLTEQQVVELSKILLKFSFQEKADIKNGYALQIICLERTNDYLSVLEMEEKVLSIKCAELISNVAYAAYHTNEFEHALKLQHRAIQFIRQSKISKEKENLIYYNLLVYLYISNRLVQGKQYYKSVLKTLLSEDVYDHISAISLAVLFDDKKFVISNFEKSKETFIYDEQQEKYIQDYLNLGKIPSYHSAPDFIYPKAIYGDNFYFTNITCC